MAIPKRHRGGEISAGDIADTLAEEGIYAEIVGSRDRIPTHVAPIDKADKGSLTFYMSEDEDVLKGIRDCVLLCKIQFNKLHESVSSIIVKDPRLCFAIIAQEFLPSLPKPGLHTTSVIDPEAQIHPTAHIGPFCTVEKCTIGEGSVIHSGVKIYANTEIGKHVEIESGAVIGASGVGRSVGPGGRHWLFPHFGKTILENDSFVGSCSVITRGVLGETVLREGSRINASVVVAHNCIIGKHSAVSIGVTISGSSIVGDRCFIGSGSALREGIKLGNNIIVGLGAVVTKSFEKGDIVLIGNPAKIFKDNI